MAGARVIRRRRNPLHHPHELPYGEWVPAHAVKFNNDGTVDVMTEAHHNPGRTSGRSKKRKPARKRRRRYWSSSLGRYVTIPGD